MENHPASKQCYPTGNTGLPSHLWQPIFCLQVFSSSYGCLDPWSATWIPLCALPDSRHPPPPPAFPSVTTPLLSPYHSFIICHLFLPESYAVTKMGLNTVMWTQHVTIQMSLHTNVFSQTHTGLISFIILWNWILLCQNLDAHRPNHSAYCVLAQLLEGTQVSKFRFFPSLSSGKCPFHALKLFPDVSHSWVYPQDQVTATKPTQQPQLPISHPPGPLHR